MSDKGWKPTKKGEEVLKEAMKIYPESRDIILADTGFRNFLVVSGTKIEGMSVNDYLKKRVNKKLCPCDGCKPDSGYDVDVMRVKRVKVK